MKEFDIEIHRTLDTEGLPVTEIFLNGEAVVLDPPYVSALNTFVSGIVKGK